MSTGTPHDVDDETYEKAVTFMTDDPTDELIISLRPQKYRLDVYGEHGLDVIATYTTYGGWNIEGDFLCVYAIDGMKAAYRLPSEALTIRTLPKGEHENTDEHKTIEEAARSKGGYLADESFEEVNDVPDQQEV